MKVFGLKFLEEMTTEQSSDVKSWGWEPANKDIKDIYASGSTTSSRESTYAAEKDDRADQDRPNEGLAA